MSNKGRVFLACMIWVLIIVVVLFLAYEFAMGCYKLGE